MSKPKALILSGFGINGELEMAQSFHQAGAETRIIHIQDLINDPSALAESDILAFPGGFAYADDLGAGIALANRLKNNLMEELKAFVQRDTLTIGICNGFQMMVNLGILPGLEGQMWERKVALKHNASNRYQCRWVNLKVGSKKCIWTKGLDVVTMSVGHGEGNFYTDPQTLSELKAADQVVVTYCDKEGNPANGEFPINPNGAMEDIAGICDSTGRIFGLMPHPDRFLTAYNADNWSKVKELAKREGQQFTDLSPAQKIYENAVAYFA